MTNKNPKKVAIELTQMLDAVFGKDRFPVDVKELIFERTKHLDDPVTKIRKVSLAGFEGMLRPSKNKREWHILYNEDSIYPGRERFTLAHEFCHYLLDREPLPETRQNESDQTFECNPLNRNLWKTDEALMEENADVFASYLLMPINDFREQVGTEAIDISLFEHVIDRYGVSLTAAILKWIEFTEKIALMVVSIDGFALWGRASDSAYKNGVFIRSGTEIPKNSHANKVGGTEGKIISIDPKTWKFSPKVIATHEMSIYATKLEQNISIIFFEENVFFENNQNASRDTLDHYLSYNKKNSL